MVHCEKLEEESELEGLRDLAKKLIQGETNLKKAWDILILMATKSCWPINLKQSLKPSRTGACCGYQDLRESQIMCHTVDRSWLLRKRYNTMVNS